MRDFAQIQRTDYDVIIIGGGINGAGVARDAALRGLNTILVEKNDFASGSSSWSTRIILMNFIMFKETFSICLYRIN